MSLAEVLPRRHNGFHHFWTKQTETRLTELWDKATRVALIASTLQSEYGIQYTRNAVIGKARRLGLDWHKGRNRGGKSRITDPIIIAERRARRNQQRQEWAQQNRSRIATYAHKYYEKQKLRRHAPLIADFNIPEAQRKTIFSVGAHDCRWPVGEPKTDLFFFCGAPVEEDRPYCSSHCQRAYAEIRPR